MKQLLVGALTMCIFAMIDSGIFLFMEADFDEYLKKFDYLDNVTRPVFLGGTSAAFAILIAGVVKKYIIIPNFKFEETPLTEFIGVLLGTMIVILSYRLLIHHDKDNKIEKLNKLKNRRIIYH